MNSHATPQAGLDSGPHVAVVFDNLGPYHLARLRAASGVVRLSSIEVAANSGDYAWEANGEALPFERVTLFRDGDSASRATRDIDHEMTSVLDSLRPTVLALPGWSDRAGLSALRWGQRNGVPAIVMSASNAFDHQRSWHREAVKRALVAMFSAGLAGGADGAAYLADLGIADDRIATGYDTVDNDYFARGADAARGRDATLRTELGLPERYFLCSCRFIEKKNLGAVIGAYAEYRRRAGAGAGADAWSLVLAGDGPLRAALEAKVAALGLGGSVQFPGFVQYDLLPAYYGLAGGLVLASTSEQWGLVVNEAMASGLPVLVSNRCGSARDLVEEGVNGFSFDPADREALVAGLQRIAADDGAMGEASRDIIARWSPERFAEALAGLAARVHSEAPPRPTLFGNIALRVLLS